MKKISSMCLGLLLNTCNTYAFHMTYIEANSNSLENTNCYVRSDNFTPYFNMTSLFAANINGQSPNAPKIFFNEHVDAVLHSSQVENLQRKGIKVLITLLGNHQNAGWSCMTDANAIKKFADDIVDMVNEFHLDGVDIDDEYSICRPNNYSIIMIAKAIKTNPKYSGKLLTKALFNDAEYFKTVYRGHTLSEYLDYGWEMSYSSSNFEARINFYLQNGMTLNRLMIGSWTALNYPDPYAVGQFTEKSHLAGNMIYDLTKDSRDYLTRLIKSENSQLEVLTLPNCLS